MIVFAGENPLIMLYRPGGSDLIAVASLWHATYTAEYGSGDSLLLWAEPAGTGLGADAPAAIYTDNAPLARWLWSTFNSRWEPLLGHGLAEIEPQPARFVRHAGPGGPHHVTCMTGDTTVDLTWSDPQTAIWTETYPYEYRTTAVIVPCSTAMIRVNGTAATGEIRPHEDVFARSAVLAFCETWMTRDPDGIDDA